MKQIIMLRGTYKYKTNVRQIYIQKGQTATSSYDKYFLLQNVVPWKSKPERRKTSWIEKLQQ